MACYQFGNLTAVSILQPEVMMFDEPTSALDPAGTVLVFDAIREMAKKHKAAPMVDEVSDFEILEVAVRELCIEKGLFTAEDHRQWIEYIHTLGPLPAARLVAKAWLDPECKKLAV